MISGPKRIGLDHGLPAKARIERGGAVSFAPGGFGCLLRQHGIAGGVEHAASSAPTFGQAGSVNSIAFGGGVEHDEQRLAAVLGGAST